MQAEAKEPNSMFKLWYNNWHGIKLGELPNLIHQLITWGVHYLIIIQVSNLIYQNDSLFESPNISTVIFSTCMHGINKHTLVSLSQLAWHQVWGLVPRNWATCSCYCYYWANPHTVSLMTRLPLMLWIAYVCNTTIDRYVHMCTQNIIFKPHTILVFIIHSWFWDNTTLYETEINSIRKLSECVC